MIQSIQVALALTLLIASPMLAGAQVGAPAQEGRLPTMFQWYYEYDPKGWRYWSQNGPVSWVERYENGTVHNFNVLHRTTVNGCQGVLLLKADDSSEVFIPDNRCESQVLIFRLLDPFDPSGPPSMWHVAGAMQQIQYSEPRTGNARTFPLLDNGEEFPIYEDTIRRDDRGFTYFTVFTLMGDSEFAVDCRTRATFYKDDRGQWISRERFTDSVFRLVCR
jgi:hypothetical protein